MREMLKRTLKTQTIYIRTKMFYLKLASKEEVFWKRKFTFLFCKRRRSYWPAQWQPLKENSALYVRSYSVMKHGKRCTAGRDLRYWSLSTQTHNNVAVRDIQQMLIRSFIVLISSPTFFGFQVPCSGDYNFLIYKLLQVVCVSGRCGLLFVRCDHLLRNAPTPTLNADNLE
jgi:hypothetical protein